MRMPGRGASTWRFALVGVVFALAGTDLVSDSGLAVSLLLSAVLLVALAAALAALPLDPSSITAGGPPRHDSAQSRRSIRQCDPDAAGHRRPRAPTPGKSVLSLR